MKISWVKRRICLLLVLVLVFQSFTGCNGNGLSGSESESMTETNSEKESNNDLKTEEDSVSKEETEGDSVSDTSIESETNTNAGDSETEEPGTEETHTHSYTETVITATCTTDGKKTFICACGEAYEEVIKATGHSFEEYQYNNDATFSKDGTQTAVCATCGEKDTKTATGTKLSYTYTDMNTRMWVKSSVNVRDLPSSDGNKLGALAEDDEVIVTGKCKETGWYRIVYKDSVGYVSDKYLTSETPKKEVTVEQIEYIKNRNIAYRYLLERDSFAGGIMAEYFGLVDIDGDGVEELSANVNGGPDFLYPSSLVHYKDGTIYWAADQWTYAGVYYCVEEKYFMVCDGIQLGNNDVNDFGLGFWIYSSEVDETCYGGFECIEYYCMQEEGIWQRYEEITLEEIRENNIPEEDIEYWYYEDGSIASCQRIIRITEEEMKNEVSRYFPTKNIVESPYKNTAENREKYLPIEDEAIRRLLESK